MAARKLEKFIEFTDSKFGIEKDHSFKGNWHTAFGNNNPIVLELACGKGDYSIGLAKLYPNINFIGVDIKGNRLWKGCKNAQEQGLTNVLFLRIQIDHILDHFNAGEIQQLWITFPDPQPSKERKRLTHPLFLNKYFNLMGPNGVVSLKTDSLEFFTFTNKVVVQNKLPIMDINLDVYATEPSLELNIQTYYEKKWLAQNRTIMFIRFKLIKETIFEDK